jgi:Cu/Ag efflux pump CusA
MQKGRNIVELGEEINQALARVRPLLPPDLKLDLIADQPSVVHKRINDLQREFLLAIGSVIVVTIILLPIRVALIAATAIPVTVAATLGVLNAVGIQGTPRLGKPQSRRQGRLLERRRPRRLNRAAKRRRAGGRAGPRRR